MSRRSMSSNVVAGIAAVVVVAALSVTAEAKGKKSTADPSSDPAVKALMQLKSSVKSGDFATRAAAVEGLGLVGRKQKKEVLPLIKEALKDAQWQVRRAAIKGLLSLGDKSWQSAIAAAMALRGLDPYREVLPLLEPLGVKRAMPLIKRVLTTPKFDGPERYLAAFKRKGGDWMVRAWLMGTGLKGGLGDMFRNHLATLPLPAGAEVYKKVLKKQTPAIQAAIVEHVARSKALEDIKFVAKLVKSKAPEVAFAAALALAHRKDASGKALLVAALSEDNTDDKKKLLALEALRNIPSTSLYAALKPYTRSAKTPISILQAVLEIHAALKNPKLGLWLNKQLNGTNVERRAVAATVLGRVQGRAALPTLHKLIRAGGHFDTRLGAAKSIADLAPKESLEVIRQVLFTEQDPRMKIALLNALGRIRTPECVPVIRSEIAQDDPNVKAAAVRAMGAIRHESAVPDLKMAFGDRSKKVRRDALVAIMSLGPQRYLSYFKSALNWVTPELLDTLTAAHGAQFLPHLKLAMASSKAEVRGGAFAALRHLDKKTRAAVAKSLAVTSKRRNQRLTGLAVAVELLPKAEAIELASTLSNEKDKLIVVACLDALGRLGAKGARALLATSIDAESESVRVAAAVALLKL